MANGNIDSNHQAALYMMYKLYLNRPQLITYRRKYFLTKEITKLSPNFKSHLKLLVESDDEDASRLLAEWLSIYENTLKLLLTLSGNRPYASSDTKRNSK